MLCTSSSQLHFVLKTWDLWKSLEPLDRSSKVKVTQDKVMESLHVLDVNEATTSRPSTILLK